MNKFKLPLVVSLLVCGLAASGYALADRDHGHGHGWARGGFGVYVSPWWGYPGYAPGYVPGPYYPYYYPPQVITVPSSPPVYIQQDEPPGASAPQNSYWYYCRNPQGYYPYVKQCPGGWQAVAPQPPETMDGR